VLPRLYVLLTLLRVKGYYMDVDGSNSSDDIFPVDRDNLLVPESVIKSIDDDIDQTMLPGFNASTKTNP